MRRIGKRWMMTIGLAALCSVPMACDRSPSPSVSDQPPNLPATPATQESAIELGSAMQTTQKRANDGDVSAMVTLARAFEGMGTAHKTEARQWFEKAAAKGDTSAKEELRMMDAADVAATRPAESSTAHADHGSSSTATNSSATSRPAVAAGDLDKVRWLDILGSFDNHDFSTVTNPNFRKNGDTNAIFVGVTTAGDKMLTVAASGDDGDNINAVSVVLRIRSHDNLNENERVHQAGLVCNAVTHGNISQADTLDWLNQYLQNGKKSDPQFRNGWSISVSGTQAEGIKDPKQFLGEAVLIEMKK